MRTALAALVALALAPSAALAQTDGPITSPTVLNPRPRIGFSQRKLQFGTLAVSTSSGVTSVQLTNGTTGSVQIDGLTFLGRGAGAYAFNLPSGAPFPLTLLPGGSETVDVTFQPQLRGDRTAWLVVQQANPGVTAESLLVRGTAYGVPGDEVVVNSGGMEYTDTGGRAWSLDYGSSLASPLILNHAIAGSADDRIYQSQRRGGAFQYGFTLPNGGYVVTVHLAELEASGPGQRVFDVLAEGVLALDDVDVYALTGARDTATSLSFPVTLADGRLELDFSASLGQAAVAGVEVIAAPILGADFTQLSFGAVATGSSLQLPLTITNTGAGPASLESLSLMLGLAGAADGFTVDLAGTPYVGSIVDALYPVSPPVVVPGNGGQVVLNVTYAPVTERYDSIVLRLGGTFPDFDVVMDGLGGHDGDPYLHVVISAPSVTVDYDGTGFENVTLDGSFSHTHEPGRSLVGFEWSEGAVPFSSSVVTGASLAVGPHAIELKITDDSVPSRSLTDTANVDVFAITDVPGVYARYYASAPGGASSLLDAVPTNADFAEVRTDFSVDTISSVGGSPYVGHVMVQSLGAFDVATADTYDFLTAGGVGTRIEVDGLPWTGPASLTVGRHTVEARWAVDSLVDGPLDLTYSVGGGPFQSLLPTELLHDETGLLPVINSMPTRGSTLGGNVIDIAGYGYFPAASVTVDWGGTILTSASFTQHTPSSIQLISPAGSGQIQVTVVTPSGTSNSITFDYDAGGSVPINFAQTQVTSVDYPTDGVWGPDGRFYMAQLTGEVTAMEFDDDYNILSQTKFAGVSLLTNNDVVGITVNPYDPPSPVKLYVAHAEHYADLGIPPTGKSEYTGAISILTGPNFDTPTPYITGLPTSNHDHGVNGIEFDNNGDLLILIGSNTNAGVVHPASGGVPESPLTASLNRAFTSKPGFNGTVVYVDAVTGLPDDDQMNGEQVDIAPGVDVEVFAPGLRNAFDLVYTTDERIYTTDNGPNLGFGAASTGATTEAPDPQDLDEINLVEYGVYYGSPNRGRGRYDARQDLFHGTGDAPIPGQFAQALVTLPSSSDGIVEYRADTFQGQLRGDLLVQKWISHIRRVQLTASHRGVSVIGNLYPWTGALDVELGPGGALLPLDHGGRRMLVYEINDPSATGLIVHDIFPWRAPSTGGHPFVIGGIGFGSLADTSVTLDGIPATLTSVSSTRIKGTVPAHPTPPNGLVDIVVSVGASSDTMVSAFRFLPPGPGLDLGRWGDLGALPSALGEVSCGIIDGKLYVVGEGTQQTYVYDILNATWLANGAVRFLAGHHHGAEVAMDRFVLIGGLGDGSEGTVQIYDPSTDNWTIGAPMPWAGGSVSTCVIDDVIYAAGGIVGATTVTNCAKYDISTDTWTALTPMPVGRNHAASATDGQRLFVFGGRDGGNFVANGFDDVQIYDPLTDTWEWDKDGVSTLAPLPQARGGMGKAIWFANEFYVFGGETLTGPGATLNKVYDRVDVYDPSSNTWRLEAPMTVPRHGVFPVEFQSRMLLPGGGTTAGFSQTATFDEFQRR